MSSSVFSSVGVFSRSVSSVGVILTGWSVPQWVFLPHLSQFLSVFHSAWIILTGLFCLIQPHFSIFSSSAHFLKN